MVKWVRPMAVFKRGKVYWFEFVWRGERIRDSTKQGNAKVARDIEAARRTQLAKGLVGIQDRPPAPTVEEFAERFLQAIQTQCASKPNTVTFYENKLASLLKWEPIAKCRLDEVDAEIIERFTQHKARLVSRRGKPLSPASINRELAVLRRLLHLAQEWKEIDRMPRISLLRGERNREFTLSYEQERLYLEMAPEELRDVAMLLLDSGLRIGEALALDGRSVHLEPNGGTSYLTVRAITAKNSKLRTVPLIEQRTLDMLKARGRKGLVFHREDGSPLLVSTLDHQHTRLRKLLKLPADFVIHSLRHTYGTRLGESGADAFTIMRLMGHSSVTVSQRYVHPTPEAMERAVSRMAGLRAGSRLGDASSLSADSESLGAPTKVPTAGKRRKAKNVSKSLN